MANLVVFPKCYIRELVEGRMSLEDWIHRASGMDELHESAAFLRRKMAECGLAEPKDRAPQ